MFYIDNQGNTDPAVNLAFEEYVLRYLDKRRAYLLLYLNKPSIIVGKHQNILEEINLAAAAELRIPIIRRISGGGTVYHDEGNLNFSLITKHTLKLFNQYLKFLKPIIKILRELGCPVIINERNNIMIGGKKISGNAQFTSRKRLLSHGTLLFDANLTHLKAVIKKSASLVEIQSRSTKSIRSAVANIKETMNSDLTIQNLKQLILDHFFKTGLKEVKLNQNDWAAVIKLADLKYRQWSWNYGQSPECRIRHELTYKGEEFLIQIEVKEGMIKNFSLNCQKFSKQRVQQFREYFLGKRYDFESVTMAIDGAKAHSEGNELNLLDWKSIFFN